MQEDQPYFCQKHVFVFVPLINTWQMSVTHVEENNTTIVQMFLW